MAQRNRNHRTCKNSVPLLDPRPWLGELLGKGRGEHEGEGGGGLWGSKPGTETVWPCSLPALGPFRAPTLAWGFSTGGGVCVGGDLACSPSGACPPRGTPTFTQCLGPGAGLRTWGGQSFSQTHSRLGGGKEERLDTTLLTF